MACHDADVPRHKQGEAANTKGKIGTLVSLGVNKQMPMDPALQQIHGEAAAIFADLLEVLMRSAYTSKSKAWSPSIGLHDCPYFLIAQTPKDETRTPKQGSQQELILGRTVHKHLTATQTGLRALGLAPGHLDTLPHRPGQSFSTLGK